MGEHKKVFVIDASFLLPFYLPDEHHKKTDQFMEAFGKGEIEYVSSPVLPFEIGNGLFTAARRNRIDDSYAKEQFAQFLELEIPLMELDYYGVGAVASTYSLSYYDASYVWIAQNGTYPMLTYDSAIQNVLTALCES